MIDISALERALRTEDKQLSSTETRQRRITFRRAPKDFAALILFLVICIIFEVLLISAFQALGLVDANAWTTTLLIPGVNWSFIVSVSLIFQILPLSVIVVLLAGWIYLKNSNAFKIQPEPAKRAVPQRRPQETGRLKSAKRAWRNLSRRFQRIGKSLKTGGSKIPGISALSKRLSSAQSVVKSTVTVLAIFGAIALALILIAYPNLIYYWTLNLYQGSPGLTNFVLGTGQWLSGIGTALPPLGDLGASINNALIQAAPGFRHSLEAAGTSLTEPILQLDAVGKYVFTQNLAAWTAALLALLYGSYASARPRRRAKGR